MKSRVRVLYLPLEFTGVSAPYEAPSQPEIHINANKTSIEDSVAEIVRYMQDKGYLKL